jgi:cytochrome d ubiquinol oxidase subunit I
MPPIDVPLVGRSGWIAIIALLHIPFFVNFVMGAPVLAVISEVVGLKKKDPRYDRFAYHLSTMALVTVGIGAFGGVGLVASNLGLFPRFFTIGANTFFWPLVLELPAFQ